MSNEVAVYQELEKKAVAVAKSGLFGVKSPEQAIALFLVAEAEKIPIMQAVMDYDIIEGKPALKAEARLRRFQSSGGVVKWVDRTDTKVSAYFSHPVHCPDAIFVSWDMEQAKRAGLSTRVQRDGKPNMWQKFPRQMLTARVIGEGTKAVSPDNAAGIYTPEEVADFDPVKISEVNTPSTIELEVEDATIVETEQKKELSPKTISKFAMAKSALGQDGFDKVLKSHKVDKIEEITDEEKATLILRDMRIAFDKSKQSKASEVAK